MFAGLFLIVIVVMVGNWIVNSLEDANERQAEEAQIAIKAYVAQCDRELQKNRKNAARRSKRADKKLALVA